MAAPILARKRVPVVVILGATGSGKSKLALEIAHILKSEIISADSMQIYKGLDIVTNKVTREELQQCPHHMIDYVSPLQEKHTIVEFRDKAVPIINNLLQRKILPIIVGGTNYYIEALLYNFLLSQNDVKKARNIGPKLELPKNYENNSEAEKACKQTVGEEDGEIMDHSSLYSDTDSQGSGTEHKHDVKKRKCDTTEGELIETVKDRSKKYKKSYEEQDSVTLHKRLQEVDPVSAERLHYNDKRKIMRALVVYDMHGVPMSEAFKAQKIDQDSKRGPLRYKDVCVFWVQSDMKVLCERIDKRTDGMIDRGLIQELLDFHQQYNVSRIQENKEVDYTHGIFQSIGFKEFHEYLIMSEDERQSEAGQNLLKKSIQNMKLVTYQYAKRQIRHIRNMFLRRQNTELPPVYSLDSTDVTKWKENVYDPAINILTSVIEDKTPDYDPLPVEGSETKFTTNYCEFCEKRFVVEQQWQGIHIKSKRHYRKRNYYNYKKKRLLTETCQILDAAASGQKSQTDESIVSSSDDVMYNVKKSEQLSNIGKETTPDMLTVESHDTKEDVNASLQ
ncbi:hypothetical protein FSP39_004248 [Pinctada imbricata]|uniref:Uncharacterized protein n=1 Tax=Pinctada imbricata TaxID=66713 RepID=A0AA88Y4T5_PINIB|nr:hypothetical protein FSP39_004248 [Pinctada imbricata]